MDGVWVDSNAVGSVSIILEWLYYMRKVNLQVSCGGFFKWVQFLPNTALVLILHLHQRHPFSKSSACLHNFLKLYWQFSFPHKTETCSPYWQQFSLLQDNPRELFERWWNCSTAQQRDFAPSLNSQWDLFTNPLTFLVLHAYIIGLFLIVFWKKLFAFLSLELLLGKITWYTCSQFLWESTILTYILTNTPNGWHNYKTYGICMDARKCISLHIENFVALDQPVKPPAKD